MANGAEGAKGRSLCINRAIGQKVRYRHLA